MRLGSLQNYARAVERAVSDKNWKAALFLQLSAAPYGILNMFLALSDLSFYHFVITTLLSRIKLISHIALGISLNQLVAFQFSKYEENKGYLYLTLGTAVVTTCAVLYIGYYAKKHYDLSQRPVRVPSILDVEVEEFSPIPQLPDVIKEEEEKEKEKKG